jgi:hypothetical protein
MPRQAASAIALDARALDDESTALALIRRFYRVEQDDAALRRIAAIADDAARGRAFLEYRESYPPHREPVGVTVQTMPPRARAYAALQLLGAIPRVED